MITRRALLALGTVAIATPLGAYGQSTARVWRVGFLSPRSRPESLDTDYYAGFLKGMRELGYVVGKNLVIEWRFADNRIDRLAELAAELVRMKVDVIVTPGGAATAAAQKATTALPILMINASSDPVARGFVASLARPGGNITGLANFAEDYAAKHVEMLLSVAPKVSRVAVLTDAAALNSMTIQQKIQAAARSAGVGILLIEVRDSEDIGRAFAQMIRENVGALIVIQSPWVFHHRRQIAELAAKSRLPSITAYREFAEAGVLMSYGQNNAESYRRAATYVDKIFKGAKPGDLPVELPMRFELVINARTAKVLGVSIPQTLRIIADQVLE